MVHKLLFCYEYVLTVLVVSHVSANIINNQQWESSQICPQKSTEPVENPYISETGIQISKYLLYDVSLEEGFNLRRDVYIRMATLVNRLGPEWALVLPVWTDVPHWNLKEDDTDMEKSKKWSTYFDLESLNRFINVIEIDDFTNHFNSNKIHIDSVMSLEHLDQFDESDFDENYEIIKANQTRYYSNLDGVIINRFDDTFHSKFNCQNLYEIRIEGFDTTLYEMIKKHFHQEFVLLISNAETILHSNYGNELYWKARMSMRFAKHLQQKGDEFRKQFLDSDDIHDRTIQKPDWTIMKNMEGDALGGPYLAVHFRRKDFAYYHDDLVPDVECAAKQINFAASNLLDKHLRKIFLSSDSDPDEYDDLKRRLEEKGHQVVRYEQSKPLLLLPGEVAIIDQWIAAHAEFFIGTLESTFSQQIHEEREILGFYSNTSHNALCAKCDIRLLLKLCKQKSALKIIY